MHWIGDDLLQGWVHEHLSVPTDRDSVNRFTHRFQLGPSHSRDYGLGGEPEGCDPDVLVGDITGETAYFVREACEATDCGVRIEGSVRLTETPAGTLDGFECLVEVLGDIQLVGTSEANLDGLAGLRLVRGSLDLWGNPELTDGRGLESLEEVAGALSAVGNPQLEDFGGLSSLESLGALVAARNPNLLVPNLDGLRIGVLDLN